MEQGSETQQVRRSSLGVTGEWREGYSVGQQSLRAQKRDTAFCVLPGTQDKIQPKNG